MRPLLLSAIIAAFFTSVASPYDHRVGAPPRVNPHSWHAPGWGIGPGGWGYSIGSPGSGFRGFARFGGVLPFYGYGFGYSSFGGLGLGGLNYYHGPVGGFPLIDGFGFAPGFVQPPVYSYLPMAPIVIQTQPHLLGPDPLQNPVIREWLPDQREPRGKVEAAPGQPAQPPQEDVPIFLKESSPERRRQSQRFVVQGDDLFGRQNYLQAIARYKQAVSSAPDLALPRFRLGIALAAYGEFGQAVEALKRGLALNPNWPLEGERLADRMGENHGLALNNLLHRAAGWVREDIRDPDRLFLLGVLLYFNEQIDKARVLFETALALSGRAPHVEAFLSAPRRAQQRRQDRDAQEPLPPPPEPDADLPQGGAPAEPPAGPPRMPETVQPELPQARLTPPPARGPRLVPPPAPPAETVRNGR